MASPKANEEFPHSLTIDIPFPTHRLANAALRSLSVDEELSPLVSRNCAIIEPSVKDTSGESLSINIPSVVRENVRATDSSVEKQHRLTELTSNLTISQDDKKTVLRVYYKATTSRMLRVAANGFFESLREIVHIMEELDVDVLHQKGIEDLEGVQGVEQGLTGTATGVGT